uniref:NAD(P)-binding domain-containing protein n=1 Tax=Aegilops tauschii TaxID=37682 RepID=N1R4M3_AEGTA
MRLYSLKSFCTGGPKLRKWYGAPDLLPKDGGAEGEEDESSDIEEPRDAVLVTNGESEIGQMVILSLILKRARIKALVKDKRSTGEAFGTYVECMVGNIRDKSFTRKTLRGVRAVICPTDDGFFSDQIDLKGVEHIVLLSQLSVYRNSGGLQAIMNSKLRKLAERDENVVLASGIPSTIIRSASLETTPGGEKGFNFTEGIAAKGKISREDAATICVEALDAIPQTTLIFEDKENLFNLAAALGCDRLVLTGIAAACHVDYDSAASSDWSFACLYLVVAESSSPQIDIHPFVKPGHEQDGVHELHRHVAVEAPDEADADDDSNSS